MSSTTPPKRTMRPRTPKGLISKGITVLSGNSVMAIHGFSLGQASHPHLIGVYGVIRRRGSAEECFSGYGDGSRLGQIPRPVDHPCRPPSLPRRDVPAGNA